MSKAILEFYPLDIELVEGEEKDKIKVIGKTKSGKEIIILDDSFEDYFYILPKEEIEIENAVLQLKNINEKMGFPMSGIEECKKKYIGKEKAVIKIYFKKGKDKKKIKDILRQLGWIEKVLESDIATTKKYWIDKKLKPLHRIRVIGEIIEESEDILVLKLEKFEECEHVEYEPKIIAVDIETYNPLGTSITSKDPIISISLVSNKGLKKVLTWKKTDTEEAEILDSELAMIERLKEIIKIEKPDMIITYGGDLFDFPYLKERCKIYKIELEFGSGKKVRLKNGAKISGGIIHIDLLPFIRNIFGSTLKTETYDLDSVAEEIAGVKKKEIDIENLHKLWDEGEIDGITSYNLKDAEITLAIFEKLKQIIFEVGKLIGQSLYDVSRMTYGQLVEWFLIKESRNHNEIVPRKPSEFEVIERSKKKYAGAFVYEPRPGLYEKISVYDFRSLYPSIIISHNIGPSTLEAEDSEYYETPEIDGKKYKFAKNKKGFIPEVLKQVVMRRATIKEILKEMDEKEENYNVLKARSYALKTIANAMYGYLGFARSRWYCLPCAESITAFGRYYINMVIKEAEKAGFVVIYGDTDSLFISLGDKSKEDAKKFFEKINEKLPGIMKLDFQGYYPRGIFVTKKGEEKGAKKKYTLIDEKGNIIVKGFASVRRDWSPISKETQVKVLEAILRDNSVEKALRILKDTIKKLKEGKASIEEVTIYTQLTRDLHEYASVGPHVAAALKGEKEGKKFIPGQIIKYIITKGKGSISERAYLVEDVIEKGLQYDPDYYIDNQVIPAVEKIFEVLGYSKDELKGKKQKTLEGFF